MRISSRGSDEGGIAGGMRVVYRRLLQEAWRLLGQLLWVASGLCLEAAVCAARFFVDLVDSLQHKISWLESTCTGAWYGRIISGVWGSLIRVARWCEPGARGWRRLATRIDVALEGRLAGCRDISGSG